MTAVLSDDQVYDAAWKNAPPSTGMDIVANHLGTGLMDELGDHPQDLQTEMPDLEGLADMLSEIILRLAKQYSLAPFDGTLGEFLDEGETDQDWLIREELRPFARNWHKNVRGML